MVQRPKVLAYYFPSWHEDIRDAEWIGPGFTEWKLLREAQPRFSGHRQPRIPVLGEFDEANPEAFDQQNALARQYGVDGYIFDFYWYDDGPYLERALAEGFIPAETSAQLDFALMWANHNLVDIFPSAASGKTPRQLKQGPIDRAAFERMGEHIISDYFNRPNYLLVNGKPWFSIYEVGSLVSGLGGLEATADALRWLDETAVAAGLGGVHLDAVVWGFDVLPAGVRWGNATEVVAELGFDSATSYVWVHHIDIETVPFPQGDWQVLEDSAYAAYEEYAADLPIPFHPNVTVGWDASPRTRQGVPFDRADYPWIPVWDPTPDEFERGLLRARDFVARHPSADPMITINAWNEWTEGSVLLPDTVNGTGFLERILTVFGPSEGRRG